MKVHFIYPNVATYYYPGVHHGLASIFGTLKANGHMPTLHYISKNPSKREILEKINLVKPDIVAFSSTTNQIPYVGQWSKWVKEEFDIPTICGGVHPTLRPEEVIAFEGIDMICRGEGELPMLEFVSGEDPSKIKNLWTKRGTVVHSNDMRPLILNLDHLALPDYDLFDCRKLLRDTKGDFAVIASRGCPFDCTYCCNHALRKVNGAGSPAVRFKTVDRLLRELELLINKYPIRRFVFADDIFTISKGWALEFCEKYTRMFDLEFTCNGRAELVDKEILRILRKAGCSEISFGVETGNESLRKEVLKRKMSNEQIIYAFQAAREAGMKTTSYNIIGIPHETSEMIEETINLNKQLAPDHVMVFCFYPYPETELYQLCEKEGLLSKRHSSSYMTDSVLELPTISQKELDRLYSKFYRYSLEREIRSFRPLIRFQLMLLVRIGGCLLGKRSIMMLMQLYLKVFRMLLLQKDNTHGRKPRERNRSISPQGGTSR